eukprot:58773-Rhodomonas_salina.1
MCFTHEEGDGLSKQLPNPLVWADDTETLDKPVMTDPEGIHHVSTKAMRLTNLLHTPTQMQDYRTYTPTSRGWNCGRNWRGRRRLATSPRQPARWPSRAA